MNFRSRVWFAIHNSRRNKFISRFARLCKNLHRASEHAGYDVNLNGERAVLAHSCAELKAPLLWDVGANVGDWSYMASKVLPQARIHAFELNPTLIKTLSQRFCDSRRVAIHPYGLSSRSGTAQFYAYEGEASVLSGLRIPLHNHVPHEIRETTVRTGDEACKLLDIKHIHFLKIDAEGHDYEVLQGFSKMLASQSISVIQFEHEGGRYLKDFYDCFSGWGYSLGKLYANYVEFRDHHFEMEHCLGPNYIAVIRDEKHLIHSLTSGWSWSKY